MEILVDTSVWIDYFRGGSESGKIDLLIDENLLAINDLILTELIPLLVIKKEYELIKRLKIIKNLKIKPDWNEIREYQIRCLRSGSSGIGIPDLMIAQNSIQHNVLVYSFDKHFDYMYDAEIGIRLYN